MQYGSLNKPAHNICLQEEIVRRASLIIMIFSVFVFILSCRGSKSKTDDEQTNDVFRVDNETDDENQEETVDDGSQIQKKYYYGIHPSSHNDYLYAKDLNINFNREGLYFFWEWVDKERNGSFSFKNAIAFAMDNHEEILIDYDEIRQMFHNVEGIEIMANVCFRGEFQNDEEKNIYIEFVEKMVERYDGDNESGCTVTNGVDCYNEGDSDAPTSLTLDVLAKNPIKYWQVCNGLEDTCNVPECATDEGLYAEKYAEFMEITYNSVKEACSDCKVIIGGDSALEKYPPVYQKLNGKFVDIIDKHVFGVESNYPTIKIELESLRKTLKDSGFDVAELSFWMTEVGTYSGDPQKQNPGLPDLPFQSEKQQADSLVKHFLIAYANGVENMLWAWGLKEGFDCECCIFDYTGLIYDGNFPAQTCDKNMYDRGSEVKKLAYYSFKILFNKIGGLRNIETIMEKKEVFLYKIIKNGNPLYIGWSDNGENVTIENHKAASLKITSTTPTQEFGENVNEDDFFSNFKTETIQLQDGEALIPLTETPVVIELN